MATRDIITVRIDRTRLFQTLTVLPALLILMGMLVWSLGETARINSAVENAAQQGLSEMVATVETEIPAAYPISGSEINPAFFSMQLPPPPLDALPYDVREPLSNGSSVPVKKRWIWVPSEQAITVSQGLEGDAVVNVPVGTLWWKEFYVETDRGTFLIERRIIARVRPSDRAPEGWAYYSSHYAPTGSEETTVVLPSTSEEAARYWFQPTDWLPTQSTASTLEVRFEDARGVQYPYVFPGQTQCQVCHRGANGAYPNAEDDPIYVFGLHPNNLTAESFTALMEAGWLVDGESLLSPDYLMPPESESLEASSFEDLTTEVVAVLRNNCASCHNASPGAAAAFSAFILDPNRAYTAQELLDLLSVNGVMMVGAHPLVTPGSLETSEIYLRLHGLEGRRRMPPREGGLADPDPRIIALLEAWILAADDAG
ncbi:MAG: hypothetical protein SF029_11865 [bacterium]|nr:hypothetical protein [bacterium]